MDLVRIDPTSLANIQNDLKASLDASVAEEDETSSEDSSEASSADNPDSDEVQ